MQITSITPITAPGATIPVLVDHDGAPVPAPCTSRYCPPGHDHLPPFTPVVPFPPVLVDHDGTPVPPPHGGHGRA